MKKYLILALFVTACATQKNKDISVQEANQREAKGLEQFTVESDDKNLIFKVKASKAPPIVYSKDAIPFYYTSVDIGTLTPVECFVYPSDISPAASLKKISDHLLREELVGKVEEKKVSLINAGAFEGNPYLMLQTAFKVNKNGKPLVGNAKTIVGTKEIGNVVCAHNEMGYQQTFLDVFTEIMKTMELTKAPKVDLKYKSVMLVRIGQLPIGYMVTYVGSNPFQANSWVEKSSLIIPTSESQVVALDELTVEVSNKKSELTYGLYKQDQDGEVDHLIEISTENMKTYSVKGTKDKQPVLKTLKARRPVLSHFAVNKMLATNFFKQDQKSFSLSVFSPDKSLTTPTVLDLKLQKINTAGAVIDVSDGVNTHRAVVERDGTELEVTFNFDKAKIKAKRIFKAGMYP